MLEVNDWKLSSLYQPAVANSLKLSTQEAFKVISHKFSVSAPWLTSFLNFFTVSVLIRSCLVLMPFDLETYLKIHFTKVGVQMKRNRLELLNEARELKMEIPMLQKLG